jgi:hypothetical protein
LKTTVDNIYYIFPSTKRYFQQVDILCLGLTCDIFRSGFLVTIIQSCFFHRLYSPRGPWPLFSVLWSFLQTVWLLGRGISPTQDRCLNTEQHKQHKHRINIHTPNIHAFCGTGTHDPGFRMSEDSSCLRPLGYCDRHSVMYIAQIPHVNQEELPLCYTLYTVYRHTRTHTHTVCWFLAYFPYIEKIKKAYDITLLTICVFHLDFLLLGYEISLLPLYLRVPPIIFSFSMRSVSYQYK